MKSLVLAILLLSPTLSIAGTPNAAEYDTNIHIATSRNMVRCGDVTNGNSFCFAIQVLTVNIGVHEYELESLQGTKGRVLLKPGNYKAKVLEQNVSDFDLRRTYELLLPDKTTRKFALVAILQ